jgi:hypothetical protein
MKVGKGSGILHSGAEGQDDEFELGEQSDPDWRAEVLEKIQSRRRGQTKYC